MRVTAINLTSKALIGSISPFIGNLSFLREIRLSYNSFHTQIPEEIGRLFRLQVLRLTNNSITGQIPANLSHCINLQSLYLGFNGIQGKIPAEIGDLSKLQVLTINDNELQGQIPQSIGNLSSLEVISARSNLLEGSIPDSFGKLKRLTTLAIGDNYLSGSIRENGELAAIKVLNLQRRGASRSFVAECEALRNIRHRNLVKITTSCSSIDFQGNHFKALVYEYMANGSLEKWLHEIDQKLNFRSRLNIAIDVACALDYLHHQCQEPIIHCDLKPSNVLLDNEMTGHVGDFGLAKILLQETTNPNESSSIGVKGTIGYAAPEYGLGGEVSREGDVYSYGILLLEIMTGKRPTDSIFENGLNLHIFAMNALSDQNVMEIVDPTIVRDDKNEVTNDQNAGRILEECISSMVEIGVACSMDSPIDRMEMSLVVQKLFKVRDTFEKSMAMPRNSIYTENVVV
ncbi:putative receptor-like protein kinase At3g47110 isoform X2 [Euphorbia lathyris]|uniref:putative receptor-like protein kinase At3g47110 isoform X2 n=1 Tax=Euphorbia lathyris TaxID=212925 RepID=UPI00331441D0